MTYRRRIPLRLCPDCGRRFPSWNAHAVHAHCPALPAQSSLLEELQDRRAERREAQGVTAEPTQPVPAHDGIPF